MAALLSATTKLCGRFGQVAPVAAAVLTRTATLSASSSLLSVYGRRWVSNIPTAPELEVALEPLEKPDHHIFHLTFNRPAARNAIGKKFLAELREALTNLGRERTARCLVVSSSVPGVFCAGADLKERSSMTSQETEQFVSQLRATFCELENLPMPSIAVIDGYALGGGMELALACDLRVAARGSSFAFPETRLGIIPGAGGTQRLPRIVGLTTAKELIFTGRRLSTDEAAERGLVDYGTEEGKALSKALSLAREIAQGAPLALRMAKRAINVGTQLDNTSAQIFEEACYAQVIPTQDRLEGLKAFAEKRSPQFTGE
mmetsp:Transcript_25172/g.44888  ORF Transcript_25172/g.44888 Transcript_25172/m.44888 type:complete len:317 (+) Transcript_25172:64-1014(+)